MNEKGLILPNMNQIFQEIVKTLQGIIESESGMDIIKLKMIRDLKLEKNQLHFKIFLPSPQYKFKDQLYSDIHQHLSEKHPDLQIHAHFINQAAYADAPNTALPQVRNFIAVASGKGGVGKSTIAVSLAVALKNAGYKVGLLDADLYGPSIPTMLGIRDVKPQVIEQQGKHKIVPIEVDGISVISLGNIIEAEQAIVLRGPRLAAIIKQFFFDTSWPELDYLIIDLPPGTGDVQLTLVQTIPLTGVIMVTTPQEVAYIDAVKAANMFEMDQIKVPVIGVIENMSWFEPEDQEQKKYFIFGEGGGKRLADRTNSQLLGQVPIKETMRKSADEGLAFKLDSFYASVFEVIVRQVEQQVALRHLLFAPSNIVQTGN
jgi:ATP-binding protein involved in chromosome partitioning